MHKNAQKVECKTRNNISRHYTWLLHGNKMALSYNFYRSFSTASKLSKRSITATKRKEKEKKERRKRKHLVEKAKDVGHFLVQNLISCACPSQNVVKRDASGKKGKLSCCKYFFD